ncbi:glycosyltransferase family 1 protein [Pseudomaricurvus sp. HS19]|uniref:glycosyltransferase family 4 protein n=1 Tax=Pseudomaricurvus sp. HS19 TaxID=2692626 RepID=UPI00136DD900|nr:glycosyltransferase family 1 protein [Pseudomaricurvus sp. HS19]MYM62871.1 glycosyltransferase [Pseudomaricurvus sp. HS19]
MAEELIAREHEVIFLVSEAFPDGLEELKGDISARIPGARVVSFSVPTPCAAAVPENAWRQMAARLLREHAIACLEPDFVHVPALLADGWGDDAVGSVGELGVYIPTSLTQHDLIPLAMSDDYMPEGPFKDYYMKKLAGVRKADLLLAISDYSRKEAIELLEFNADKVVNISSAADELFLDLSVTGKEVQATLRKFGIGSGYFLYAPGGFDPRKNIGRLIEAYAMLPADIREQQTLVIASKLYPGNRESVENNVASNGLSSSKVILTDYVEDKELIHLYSGCTGYVFPSLHEGFGLPVLEAMLCGAPVLASNQTCIPEVIDNEEALFDPFSTVSIAEKMARIVSDQEFRSRLIAHARVQPEKFSWTLSAKRAVDALEAKSLELQEMEWRRSRREELPGIDEMLEFLDSDSSLGCPDEKDVKVFRQSYNQNMN